MSNIITFKVPAKVDDDGDALSNTFDKLKANTDQIIFIQKTTDGELVLGHSDLNPRDMIVFYHQIQRFIQLLLERGLPQDDDEDGDDPYVN